MIKSGILEMERIQWTTQVGLSCESTSRSGDVVTQEEAQKFCVWRTWHLVLLLRGKRLDTRARRQHVIYLTLTHTSINA